MDLPAHDDAEDAGAPGATREVSTAVRLVVGLLIAAVVVVVMLHLTGVVGPLGD